MSGLASTNTCAIQFILGIVVVLKLELITVVFQSIGRLFKFKSSLFRAAQFLHDYTNSLIIYCLD